MCVCALRFTLEIVASLVSFQWCPIVASSVSSGWCPVASSGNTMAGGSSNDGGGGGGAAASEAPAEQTSTAAAGAHGAASEAPAPAAASEAPAPETSTTDAGAHGAAAAGAQETVPAGAPGLTAGQVAVVPERQQPDKNWKREDFFQMTRSDIHTMKLRLAACMKVNYCRARSDKPMGYSFQGIPGMTATDLKNLHTELTAMLANPTTSATEKARKAKDDFSKATVISGCHVLWAPTSVLNKGYIMDKGLEMVKNWDASIERRAGGYDPEVDPAGQEFVCTNMSSLLALCMEVVYHWKHNSLTDALTHAFTHIRVTLLMNSSRDEIAGLNASENVAQMKRKSHSELDNIKLVEKWVDNMKPFKKLNSQAALDVYKFCLCLRDPRQDLPSWLQDLLGKNPPTMESKVASLAKKDIGIRELNKWKAEPMFEDIKNYYGITNRLRFLKGFDPKARDALDNFFSNMGARGVSHRKFPLSNSILLSPDILTSAAFTRGKEQDSVPAWRDGAAGAVLQCTMVTFAEKRYMEFGWLAETTNKPLFNSGATWVAFSRLMSFIESIFKNEFGQQNAWPDTVTNFFRTTYRGEYDNDLLQLSSVLPSALDTNIQAMHKRLREQFQPLARLFLAIEESKKVSVVSVASNQKEEEAADKEEEKKADQLDKLAKMDVGDITSSISAYGDMTVSEKKSLVQKLNTEAQVARDKAIRTQVEAQAAAIMRARVKTFASVTDMKHYMESHTDSQLQMRMGLIDCTMPSEVQTGSSSRRVSKEPSQTWQEDVVKEVQMVPSLPVVSTVVIRAALHSCFPLLSGIDKTHPHKRQVIVPIDVPLKHLRYIASGQARASGPVQQERSGIDFFTRTIGHAKKSQAPRESDDEASEESVASDGEKPVVQDAAKSSTSITDPNTMTMSQLVKEYGIVRATEISQATFQHANRICEAAKFREVSSLLEIQLGERGAKKIWRKGQLDPSVFFRAFESVLSSVTMPVSSQDVFVNFTGGTPECLVAAMACGFQHVFAIMPQQDMAMMMLPSEEQEKGGVDYSSYVSLDPENPSMGVLAAEGVRQLSRCIQNHINSADYMRVEPIATVNAPAEKTYCYFQVTDQIVAKSGPPKAAAAKEPKKAQTSSSAASSSDNAKKQPPPAPTVEGDIDVVVGEEVSGEEEDGEGEDGEEEAEGSATNIDEEIKKIQEQMKQGTKRQTSKAGGGRAKKPKAGGGK